MYSINLIDAIRVPDSQGRSAAIAQKKWLGMSYQELRQLLIKLSDSIENSALARLLCSAMYSMQASSSLRNAMQSTTRRISRCVKSVSVSCTVSNEWQARRRQGRVVDVYVNECGMREA